MSDGDQLLRRSVRVHPTFLVGVALLLVATGALLAKTLFAGVAAVTGVSVVAGATLWLVLALVTMTLGFLRSFEVDSDAQ